jgi:P27 family predicted phage terminase small subunit
MARPQLAPEIHALKGTSPEPRKRPSVSEAATSSRPTCPRHIKAGTTAHKAWREAYRLMLERGTLDEAAGPTLIIYATTMARFLEAKADVLARGMMITVQKSTSKGDLYDVEIENPMLAIQVDAEAQLLQITKSLGIDPSAREKVLRVKGGAGPAKPGSAASMFPGLFKGKN